MHLEYIYILIYRYIKPTKLLALFVSICVHGCLLGIRHLVRALIPLRKWILPLSSPRPLTALHLAGDP